MLSACPRARVGRVRRWVTIVVVASAAPALASPPLRESETNDSYDEANLIAGAGVPAAAVEGWLGPDATSSGIDFSSFDVQPDLTMFTVSVFNYTPDAADNDSYLGLYQPPGSILDADDDGNPGFLSSMAFDPTKPGRWAAAVTGAGDFWFAGENHTQQFDYRVVVSTGASVCEVGGNDSLATAQLLPDALFVHGAAAVEGVLAPDSTPSGIDFYSIQVQAGTLVTASVFDFTPFTFFDSDGLLAVYGPDGSLVAMDDADGPGFLPAMHFFAPTNGAYTFALTGLGDYDFDGAGHGESFDYRLVISVPEPASVTLLAAGAAWGLRRR